MQNQTCSKKYIQRYLDEYCYRFNRRYMDGYSQIASCSDASLNVEIY